MPQPTEPAARLLCRALGQPKDGDRPLLVAFVQSILGCGCPTEVIRTAKLSAPSRPLGDYLAREANASGWAGLSRRVSPLLGLPEQTAWPPTLPWRWRPSELQALPAPQREALARLKRLCSVRAGLLIDVPSRALFVVAMTRIRPSPPGRLAELHAAASMVKELAGYNRVRLFSLSAAPPSGPLPSFQDAAITWEAVLSLLRSHGAAEAAAALSRLIRPAH